MPPGQAKKWYGDGFQRDGGGGLGLDVGGLLGGLGLGGLLGGTGWSTPTAVTGPKYDPSTLPALPSSYPNNANGFPDLSGTGAASGGGLARAKDLPFVSQTDPVGKDAGYLNGEMNCGPALLASAAKARGMTDGLTDAQLVTKMGQIAGTTDKGTSGNGMIAGLEALGMTTAAAPGADLNFVNSQLAQGNQVFANGDFYSVAGRMDPNMVAGHYIGITGVNNGIYTVTDPADPNVRTMTAQQLQSFIASHPEGGFVIGAG